MMQALANLIHARSEEMQNTPKNQSIPVKPIDTNKNHTKEQVTSDNKNKQ